MKLGQYCTERERESSATIVSLKNLISQMWRSCINMGFIASIIFIVTNNGIQKKLFFIFEKKKMHFK